MGTLQRNAPTMAVQLAEAEARIAGLNNHCTELERIGTTTTGHLEEACRNIVDRYMPRADIGLRFQTISEHTNNIDARIHAMMIELENLQQCA